MITSKNLKDIKEVSLNQYDSVYLCNIAEDLEIEGSKEYLLNNLDNTMISSWRWYNPPRWACQDLESRINWLDKHIKLLS